VVHIAGDMPEVGMDTTKRDIKGHGLSGVLLQLARSGLLQLENKGSIIKNQSKNR
jgi:hypothetical protein